MSNEIKTFFTPKLLKLLEARTLFAKRAFLGSRQGGHISPKKGHGIEFSDYRQYQLGDSPRDIDWGVYARSDRLYVKRFQEEEELTCLIVVDPSASVSTFNSKKIASRQIALSLSYVALLSQDTVILSGGKNLRTAKLTGGKAFSRLLQMCENNQPHESLFSEMKYAASRISFPGMCFVISDFLTPLDELFESLNYLRAKNLNITLICVRDRLDEDPYKDGDFSTLQDIETNEENNLLWDENERKQLQKIIETHDGTLQKFSREAQIKYLQFYTDSDPETFILQTLVKSSLIR